MSYGLYTLYLNLITLIFASAFVCAHILHALLTHTLVAHIRIEEFARAPCAPSIIIIIFKFRVIARLNDHFSKKCVLGCVVWCVHEKTCVQLRVVFVYTRPTTHSRALLLSVTCFSVCDDNCVDSLWWAFVRLYVRFPFARCSQTPLPPPPPYKINLLTGNKIKRILINNTTTKTFRSVFISQTL